jgi:hypothetical protein
LGNPPSRFETPSPDTPSPIEGSPSQLTTKAERRISRPASTVFSHNPPLTELSEDTPPELQPIFTYLNNHANKLYHEGYFLKLNDLDTRMCCLMCLSKLTRTDSIAFKRAGLVPIDNGLNAMRNLLELYFQYGMPLRWTQHQKAKKSLPRSSIWRMLQFES